MCCNHPELAPTWAGEPSIRPVAAAIANAIFEQSVPTIRPPAPFASSGPPHAQERDTITAAAVGISISLYFEGSSGISRRHRPSRLIHCSPWKHLAEFLHSISGVSSGLHSCVGLFRSGRLMGQNVKSPFSNIRAGTFKLYPCLSRIADPNRRKSRPATKSP